MCTILRQDRGDVYGTAVPNDRVLKYWYYGSIGLISDRSRGYAVNLLLVLMHRRLIDLLVKLFD
jgi:hypothetical protein